MKNIILDTNTYSALCTGDEAVHIQLKQASVVSVSIFMLGELYAGFRNGIKVVENKNKLAEFLRKSSVQVIDATDETALVFGDIRYQLQKAGTPLPINDVWIAAQAIEHGAILITYDKHFKKVAGLRLWDY